MVETTSRLARTTLRPSGRSEAGVREFVRWAAECWAAFGRYGIDAKTLEYLPTVTVHRLRYDRETNACVRSVSGRTQIDAVDGKPVSARNVIVLWMPLSIDPHSEPGYHRPIIGQIGQGKAWVFREGRVFKGTWRKADVGSLTRFFDWPATRSRSCAVAPSCRSCLTARRSPSKPDVTGTPTVDPSRLCPVRHRRLPLVQIQQFDLPGLGHLSALLADEATGQAAVIDPRRDVDIYLEEAGRRGVRIGHVLETHLHNDYVSGARELAELTGARHVIGAGAELGTPCLPVRDGDVLRIGGLRVTVLETPGHTPEHVSYVVADAVTRGAATSPSDAPAPDGPAAIFTGGSLLVGSVGRTDLLGAEHARPYARAMYRSLHEKLLTHADPVGVLPTHGAGSLCSRGTGDAWSSTIGVERVADPLLAIDDPEAFADALLAGQPAFPRYFARMRGVNQAGPGIVGRHPRAAPARRGGRAGHPWRRRAAHRCAPCDRACQGPRPRLHLAAGRRLLRHLAGLGRGARSATGPAAPGRAGLG